MPLLANSAPNISRLLLTWYGRHARKLPWRRSRDPYRIWISEVMLQQTTVKAVIPHYQRWMKRYPSLRAFARAEAQEVLRQWQGLGYYQRARNAHQAAKIFCEEFRGRIPADPERLARIPGFGPYTVGAVSSMAFQIPLPVVDANVRRVMMRILGIKDKAGPEVDRLLQTFLTKAIPKKRPGDYNQALMELGALVCRSQNPLCLQCPLRKACLAFNRGEQEIIPGQRARPISAINAVVAVIKRSGKYFIQKRGPKGLLADLWEFPGGKIEAGETARAALSRELREELGVDMRQARQGFKVTHYYTRFKVTLSVWFCETVPDPRKDQTHRWVSRGALKEFPMPSGSAKIVERLVAEDQGAGAD